MILAVPIFIAFLVYGNWAGAWDFSEYEENVYEYGDSNSLTESLNFAMVVVALVLHLAILGFTLVWMGGFSWAISGVFCLCLYSLAWIGNRIWRCIQRLRKGQG